MPYMKIKNSNIFYKTYGRGQPLLIMHGGPGADHLYMLSLKELSKQYRLIFVDHRGNGKSKISDYATLNFEYFTADIENLRKHLSINKWAVLGHSFGGMVAQEYALRYSDKLTHLILVDTGCNARIVQEDAPQVLKNWGYSESSVNWADRFFNGELSTYQIPYALLRFGKAYYYKLSLPTLIGSLRGKHNPKTFLKWFGSNFRGWDISENIKNIDVPTLIIAGDHDFQFPPEHQKFIAEQIKNSTLKIINEAGHNTPIECPHILNKEIEQFLKSNSAEPAPD
jgi:proline iminopeptidase